VSLAARLTFSAEWRAFLARKETPMTTIAQPSAHQPAIPRNPALFLRKAVQYVLKRALAPLALRGCTHVASGARVRGWPVVENEGGEIRLGKNFAVFSYLAKVQLYAGPGGKLTIGDDSFVNNGTILSATTEIRIGDRVNIAPHCVLIDNDFHGTADRNAAPKTAPIVLEDDVWLGTRVTVLKGVTIGRGSVIASGSVVTKDIPPGVLAGGVPARVIKRLDGGAA
jgi:maltose O-acetyltransferase